MNVQQPNSWHAAIACTLLLVMGMTTWAWARQRPEATVPVVEATDAPPAKERLREGSVLRDVSGVFRVTGDRVTFYPTDSTNSYRALENLALERIANTLKETLRDREWIISGTVTEYRGANYLLVSRSVLKNAQE